MSARIFENFIDGWVEYADNKFAPKSFHLWAGLSLVAAALERKVWMPVSHAKNLYPNVYVFLIGLPGVGKSSAIDHVTDFIREHNLQVGDEKAIRLIPDQVTEAKLIEIMSKEKSFSVSPERTLKHCSAFYPASEASNCLKEIKGAGDLVSSLTNFHDCPADWRKGTKKDNIERLSNVCFNLLAGSTFDYLGKLITGDSLFGGFASRVIYVVHGGKIFRQVRFGEGEDPVLKIDTRNLLLNDFQQIASIHGRMRGDQDFVDAYEAWFPKFEEERQSHKSEKMQALMARKSSNALKVAMLLSVAESNELVLKLKHWERALSLLSEVEKDLPNMLRVANASYRPTADNLIQTILRAFEQSPDRTLTAMSLKGTLTLRGFDPRRIDATLTSLASTGTLKIDNAGGVLRMKLLVDPNEHL